MNKKAPRTSKQRSFKHRLLAFSSKLGIIFIASFLIFYWLTHNTFKQNELLKQTSRVTNNFIKSWESKLPPALNELFYTELKPTQQEELLNYKLTMVSKSLDQYFKNLLLKTQEQIANDYLLTFFQSNRNYYNQYKVKRDLQKHLEQNRDLLEFSIYKLDGSRVVSLKHKNIPDYYISSKILGQVKSKKNLLLKHKNSANLVLLSSVTYHDEQVLVISQTINPVFFTRILSYLEASKELFYLKDSDDFIIVDNYDAKSFYAIQKSKPTATSDHRFISLYETFVGLHEKTIKIDLDKVEYSLGMVVERNNIWGNIFSVITLVFIIFISKVAIDAIYRGLHSLFSLSQRVNQRVNQQLQRRHAPIKNHAKQAVADTLALVPQVPIASIASDVPLNPFTAKFPASDHKHLAAAEDPLPPFIPPKPGEVSSSEHSFATTTPASPLHSAKHSIEDPLPPFIPPKPGEVSDPPSYF